MDDFPKEVESFYESLEQIKSLNIWDIIYNIKYTDKLEGKLKQDIIAERKVFSLIFNNGKLISNSQLTDVSGQVENSVYFSSDEILYIQNRLNQTSNTFLRARYANVLWQELKNNSYAITAIQYYIKLILDTSTDNLTDTLPYLQSIMYISKVSKQEIETSKSFIKDYLSKTEDWYKVYIVSAILDLNFFNKDELTKVSDHILNWVNTDNYTINKDLLEIALKLFKKIKKSDLDIYALLAYNEDLIINQHPDEKDFIRIIAFGHKAQYLKKAHKDEEYQNTMVEYTNLKQKVKLNKIEIQLDEEIHATINKYIEVRLEFLFTLSPEAILAYFACDESILVDPEENRNRTKSNTRTSLKNIFTINNFDINNNFKKLSDSEKVEKDIFNNYSLTQDILFYSLFISVFIEGCIRGKLNYYLIYNFFESNTWYGQRFKLGIKDDYINDSSTWLSMLAPGLHNLFSQLELSAFLQTNKINNFILSLDSLTLKFEGALRDFIRLTGGSTTFEKDNIFQEHTLEALLNNQKVKDFFSDRDIALFKYTFTKEGLNIRNNIAHCFFKYSEYNLKNVTLVFLCLLRLGKYELNYNNE